MQNLVRREVVDTAHTIIIKVGTNVLSRPDDTLDEDRIASLAEQIHHIRESGRQVVVVSSGAVGAGIGLLKLDVRPNDLAHLQAAAAAGQARLIGLYDDCLQRYGLHAAQLLLTANVFNDRVRYLNVRNTMRTLFEYGVVPIVNENDTVSVDEIRFSDNDSLAAMLVNLVPRPLLVILSVVDGLYDHPPGHPDARRVALVENWDDDLLKLAGPDQSSRGRGGMTTKLQAVRAATAVGENVIIADGTQEDVLDRILAGADVGTLFLAGATAVPAWKRWIGFTVSPNGDLLLDAGACRAILQQGRSLLAIGIASVNGDFGRGEVVSLVNPDGQEIARGLANYNSDEVRRIAGHRTEQVADILGRLPYAEVVHRDNLAITG